MHYTITACSDASCRKHLSYLRGSVSELVTAAYVHASLGPVTAGSHLPALPPLEPGEGEGCQAAVHHASHMEGLQSLTKIVQGRHLHVQHTIRHIIAAVMGALCRGRGRGRGRGKGRGRGRERTLGTCLHGPFDASNGHCLHQWLAARESMPARNVPPCLVSQSCTWPQSIGRGKTA